MAQNRAAVAVEQPGPLLALLEALVGTEAFKHGIEEASKALAATRQQAEDTAAAMERCAGPASGVPNSSRVWSEALKLRAPCAACE